MIGKDILYLIFNTWYYWTILTAHRHSIFHSLYFYILEQSDVKEFSQKELELKDIKIWLNIIIIRIFQVRSGQSPKWKIQPIRQLSCQSNKLLCKETEWKELKAKQTTVKLVKMYWKVKLGFLNSLQYKREPSISKDIFRKRTFILI